MILIAHRGNMDGPRGLENHPSYIKEALAEGFDCEIDVWSINRNYILGHDSPEFFVKPSFLKDPRLWCHAKNLEALERMLKDGIHCFWHEEDDFTLTSEGYIWTYPNKMVGKKSIIVDNDKRWINKNYDCLGVCSNWVCKK